MLLKASKSDPPIGAIIVANAAKKHLNVDVEWGSENALDVGDGVVLTTSASIIRFLCRSAASLNLYGGSDPIARTEIDHWLNFSSGPLACPTEFNDSIAFLASSVAKKGEYLVGNGLSAADYAVFGALQASRQWQDLVGKKKADAKVAEWYSKMASRPEMKQGVRGLPKDARLKMIEVSSRRRTLSRSKGGAGAGAGAASGGGGKAAPAAANKNEGGKFVELPGAEMGKVVVRFPPEASGYLHIGHAKAAMLNRHYRDTFRGRLILRFDDTNPAKEKEEFEDVIRHDLKLMEVGHDHFSRTSDHFQVMLDYCQKLIKEGKAYVDDTDAETMKAEREARQESKRRSNSVAKNLEMWDEMVRGTELGQKCAVRAKIDMKSDNGCMRDPTIYRCKPEPHAATGDRYKVYPTYDFACPIVDSIEGVTHALRTTEYMDRDEQFFWFIEALGLRRPHIYAYSRLSMTNTVMSKRKLTWLVDNGAVDGWDDPRLPTVRGVLRRGLTVQALRDFIVSQGSSRSVVFMEWDKIWAMNKKVIDPVAPRYTTVSKDYNVPVSVSGVAEEEAKADLHPKDPSVGQKSVWRAAKVLIDGADAEQLQEGANATFINWGNLKIDKVVKSGGKVTSVEATPNLLDKDFKKTLKLTWLAETDKAPFTPTTCVYYDHIISKPVLDKEDDFKSFVASDTKTCIDFLGDPELRKLKKGDIVQIQRRGFFIVDRPYVAATVNTCKSNPIRLIAIPDGTPGSYGPPGKKKAEPTTSPAKGGKKNQQKGGNKKQEPAAPTPAAKASGDASGLYAQVEAQGNLVRKLKGEKASKDEVQAQVKVLLDLKAKYKEVAGHEWKPGAAPAVVPAAPAGNISNGDTSKLYAQVEEQGNLVRKIKGEKASKDEVQAQVKVLLDLKAKYKEVAGKEWKPGQAPVAPEAAPAKPSAGGNGADLYAQVEAQGNLVRKIKGEKASKDEVQAQVKILLDLKAKYKDATGQEWKPGQAQAKPKEASPPPPQQSAAIPATVESRDNILRNIVAQGDVVRQLKAAKAAKQAIEGEVNKLLALKAQYENVTGEKWKPGLTPSGAEAPPAPADSAKPPSNANDDLKKDLNDRIVAQGDLVRKLKSEKADAADVDANVKILLGLKEKYKEKVGEDWKPPGGGGGGGGRGGGKKDKKPKQESKKEAAPAKEPGQQKQTRLGMEAKKEENLADWYSQVITKAEMLEYYDVSGCYILRPWSYSIWESVQDFVNAKIKKLGVSNCYFPMFVAQSALQREKDHIEDFAPEVAWVTKSGETELAEPIAIRPTSETVMYPAYAKWIQSYRDLPIRLNQWCNVVRWEFKHPQPFLRTREFLWQEGHSAFADKAEAEKEVMDILDIYAGVYEVLLAIPVVRGRKTEKEKFAGGEYTTTVEAYITAAGRAIQGGTSHHLGQNFSKMFEVVFEHPETGEKQYVYQNSWGITTRTIGVLTMVHGDNNGLVLPPKVAKIQVIIVPCGITVNLKEADRKALYDTCREYERELEAAGVRVSGDYRENYSPGWKFNHWELKGVPVRLEVGPRDVKQSQYVAVRRHDGAKVTKKKADVAKEMPAFLDEIQRAMFDKAKRELDAHIKVADTWKDFLAALEGGNLIVAPFCGEPKCEEEIKDRSKGEVEVEEGAPSMGAKSLCCPFQQPKEIVKGKQKCVLDTCKKAPVIYTMFGRSY